MTTALASLLSGRPVKHTVGMTGEVTLQGRVLPIGGLKQKVLAAHAAGLTDVIIPERNRADLDDVPADVREAMRVPPGDDARRGARRSRSSRRSRAACAVRSCTPIPEEVARAADLLERRWTLVDPLGLARAGAVRFNEFKQALEAHPAARRSPRASPSSRRPASSSGRSSTRARRASSTG